MTTRDFITPIEDSRRWAHVPYRPDDIVIATPPKSGTTWTQGIVSSLLWPEGDAPGELGERSPWVDIRITPVEELATQLTAQQHRRFIKTHSPADAIPISDEVRYVTVYRSAPDAFVSWGNHRAKMRPEVMEFLNALAAADGIDPVPLTIQDDYDLLYEEWSAYWSPAIHLAPWWPLRHRPNVLMLHYADLSADLDGQMRRIAEFLDIEVPDALWPQVRERCRLDSMREEARAAGRVDRAFEGGADSFFHKGGNGRGREMLTSAQVERCQRHCGDLLPADALEWLESGWLALDAGATGP